MSGDFLLVVLSIYIFRLPEHDDHVNDKLWAKSETFRSVAGYSSARTNNKLLHIQILQILHPAVVLILTLCFLLNEVYSNPRKLSMLYILLFRNTVLSTDPHADTPCSPRGTIKLVLLVTVLRYKL